MRTFAVNPEGVAEPVEYTSPAGRHRHRCECGCVWEHGDENNGLDKPHECPECGEYPIGTTWFGFPKYLGPEAPHASN